jgi:hypothetical protein
MLLKCRSTKKIFSIISVFFIYGKIYVSFSLVFCFYLIRVTQTLIYTRSSLTNLHVSRDEICVDDVILYGIYIYLERYVYFYFRLFEYKLNFLVNHESIIYWYSFCLFLAFLCHYSSISLNSTCSINCIK